MTSNGDNIQDRPGLLANPYLVAPGRPAVWGVTLGGVGLAAVGVLAVAAPVSGAAPAGAPVAGASASGSSLDGSTEVFFGAATDVDTEVQAVCMPSGYLWPGEPCDDAPVSPALA